MTQTFKTTDRGFVVFNNQNTNYTGDYETCVRIIKDKIYIYVSNNGILSPEFRRELYMFCEDHGIDTEELSLGAYIEATLTV